MTTEELITAHRAHAAELRALADKHDAIADELEQPRVGTVIGKRGSGARKAKQRKAGKQRPRPTGGRTTKKAVELRERIRAYVREHPDAKGTVVAKALGIGEGLAYYHLAALRKAA